MRLIAIALLLSSCSMAEIRTWSLHDYDLECYVIKADWDGRSRICDAHRIREGL